MEHAELIASSFADTRNSLFRLNRLPHWFKLFLSIALPIIFGVIISSLILQLIVKPFLVDKLVNDNLGFTENNIGFILSYLSIMFGFLCVFIFPFFQGYMYKVMRLNTVPETQKILSNFFKGWRVNVILLYFSIPLFLIFLIYALIYTTFFRDITMDTVNSGIGAITSFILTVIIIATIIFIALFALIGLMHMARTGRMREGVNLHHIIGIIKKIGWYNYILTIVFMAIIFLIFYVIFLAVDGAIGSNLVANCILIGAYTFVMIPVTTFLCRYLSRVYDTAFIKPEEDTADFDDF